MPGSIARFDELRSGLFRSLSGKGDQQLRYQFLFLITCSNLSQLRTGSKTQHLPMSIAGLWKGASNVLKNSVRGYCACYRETAISRKGGFYSTPRFSSNSCKHDRQGRRSKVSPSKSRPCPSSPRECRRRGTLTRTPRCARGRHPDAFDPPQGRAPPRSLPSSAPPHPLLVPPLSLHASAP